MAHILNTIKRRRNADTTHISKQIQKKKKRKQYTHIQTLAKEEEPHTIHKHLNNITRRRRNANNAQTVKHNRKQKKNRK